MSNPEERGNPAKQAMDLIQQLETKVREKNEIIDGLKGEIVQLKDKVLAGYVKANWSTLLIGVGLGAGLVIVIAVTFALWK